MCALTWGLNGQLWVATRAGELISADTVLGTRVAARGLGDVTGMSCSAKGRWLLLVTADRWLLAGRGGEPVLGRPHRLVGDVQGFLVGEHVVLLGDDANGRRTLSIFKGERRTAHVKLPARASATVSEQGGLLLLRSTEEGMEVLPLAALEKGRSFRRGLETTTHRLRGCGQYILGFTRSGLSIWSSAGGQPRSIRQTGINAAAVRPQGGYLAFGCDDGLVGVWPIDRFGKLREGSNVRTGQGPIRSLAFSPDGAALAVGGNGASVWSDWRA